MPDINTMVNSATKIDLEKIPPIPSENRFGQSLLQPDGRKISFLSKIFILSKVSLIPIGLGIFFLGLIICISVLSKTTFNIFQWSSQHTEIVSGEILYTIEVDKVFGKWPVYGNIFRYQLNSGEEIRGISYSQKNIFKRKDIVEIKYIKDRPLEAIIDGTWNDSGGYRTLFILGIPLIGLIFVLFGLKQGLSQLRFLKFSPIELAFLIDKKLQEENSTKKVSANVHQLVAPLYLMTYFYVSPQGQKYQFTVTERIDQTALQKDPSEPILINPKDPEHPILIKAMSRDLHFSQDGQSVEAGLNLNIIFLVVVAVVYTVLIWKLCGDFIR